MKQTYLVIAATVAQALLACGQIALKIFATRLSQVKFANIGDSTVFLPVLVSATVVGIIYAVTIVVWVFVLSNMPVNKAFLFVSLSFIFVPLFSAIYLKETIEAGTIVGTILIIAGITIGAVWR